MNKRRAIAGTALFVILLIAILGPLACWLEEEKIDDELRVILDMLIEQEAHENLPQGTLVAPVMDIEEIWALEDERTEAQESLIDAMHLDAYEMGYDAQSCTFYASLGKMDSDWPAVEMYARGSDGVQVVWVDDYAYDSCADAIREGYRYEIFAYTDEEFSYAGVVFTSLPIVTVHGPEGVVIDDYYLPGRVSVSGQGYEAVDTAALVHKRGGGYNKPIDKDSYRIQLHDKEGTGTEKKVKMPLLGMEEDTDWLLLSNAQDRTAVNNYLAFDLWDRWNPDGALMKMDNRLVEVFVNDMYMGIYQLMQRLSAPKEIQRAGGNPETDSVVRVVQIENESDRPIVDMKDKTDYLVEYVWSADNDAQRVFSDLENYVKLTYLREHQIDDEEFAELALRYMDVEEVVSYFLFLQSCGLVHDNVFNNLYIWLFWENDRYVYRLSPWDMDRALYVSGFHADGTSRQHFDMSMIMACRMLDLNLLNCRETIWSIWQEKRATILSDEALHAWIMDVEEEINASGAYLRETEKWRGGAQELNLTEVLYFETERMKTIEWNLNHYWPIGDGE